MPFGYSSRANAENRPLSRRAVGRRPGRTARRSVPWRCAAVRSDRGIAQTNWYRSGPLWRLGSHTGRPPRRLTPRGSSCIVSGRLHGPSRQRAALRCVARDAPGRSPVGGGRHLGRRAVWSQPAGFARTPTRSEGPRSSAARSHAAGPSTSASSPGTDFRKALALGYRDAPPCGSADRWVARKRRISATTARVAALSSCRSKACRPLEWLMSVRARFR